MPYLFARVDVCVSFNVATDARLTWRAFSPYRSLSISYQPLSENDTPIGGEVVAQARLPGWRSHYDLHVPHDGKYRVRVHGRQFRFFQPDRIVLVLDRTVRGMSVESRCCSSVLHCSSVLRNIGWTFLVDSFHC